MSPLSNKKVAILVEDGFEECELTVPRKRLQAEGADVAIVSPQEESVLGFEHFEEVGEVQVDLTLEEASAGDFDALVLPGGVHNPDQLRVEDEALMFVRDFIRADKPVAAICHGSWTLINADVLSGKTLTSVKSIRKDLENAGANWVDKRVHNDDGLITSRNPNDLQAFCDKIIEVMRQES